MATKTQVVLIDDFTGDPADTTVKFALDKTEYEIDLSDENAAEMREELSRYVDAARKVTGGGRRSAPPATESLSRGELLVAGQSGREGEQCGEQAGPPLVSQSQPGGSR